MAYNNGLVGPYDWSTVTQNGFAPATALWFTEQYPLVTRLQRKATSAITVYAVDDAYRARSTTANAAVANNTVTSLTLTDASFFLVGDVVLHESEKYLITAINTAANTATITRGYQNTTAAAHNNSTTISLIGNTRTGGEVDQDAVTRTLDANATYCQTVQHPWQVAGSLDSASPSMAIPAGFGSWREYVKFKAMGEAYRDFEVSMYRSGAVALAADTTRPAMAGLENRLSTCKSTQPTNYSAYKPSDFVRDIMAAPGGQGGKVDVIVCSNEYRNGFAIWGMNLEQVRWNDPVFGVDFQDLVCPGLGGATILFSPLLPTYTAIGLTSQEVSMYWKRAPASYDRGRRGDAFEGDVIGEGTIVVNNEAHHAWVSGVTAFAKQA
jgi:hypothetical protein